MNPQSENHQYAPWPYELESLVIGTRYRHGWRFDLSDQVRDPAESHGEPAGGLTLTISTLTVNSYDQHDHLCDRCGQEIAYYRVHHIFPVPPATYDRQGWLDWLMDRIEDVERHEAREFFRLVHTKIDSDGTHREIEERPMAPNHGPGRDPYRRHSYASDEDRRTRFTGVVNES